MAKKAGKVQHGTKRGTWHKVDEARRVYFWAGNTLELHDVTAVKVSESGTHYVTCKEASGSGDVRHVIVAPGWLYIKLQMKDWTF